MKQLLTLIMFLTIGFSGAAWAGDAHILILKGDVSVKPSGGDQWQKAALGQTLSKGTEVKTAPGAACTLSFNEKNSRVVKVSENTQVRTFDGDGVFLPQGRVFALIKDKNNQQPFEVRTPTAVAGARGTGWITEHNDGLTKISCLDDIVYVAPIDAQGHIGDRRDLAAGLELEVRETTGASEPKAVEDQHKQQWQDFISDVKPSPENNAPENHNNGEGNSEGDHHQGVSDNSGSGHHDGGPGEGSGPSSGSGEGSEGKGKPNGISEGGPDAGHEQGREKLSQESGIDPDLRNFIERRSDSGRIEKEQVAVSDSLRQDRTEQRETVQEAQTEQKQTVQEQEQQQVRVETESGSGTSGSGDSGSGSSGSSGSGDSGSGGSGGSEDSGDSVSTNSTSH